MDLCDMIDDDDLLLSDEPAAASSAAAAAPTASSSVKEEPGQDPGDDEGVKREESSFSRATGNFPHMQCAVCGLSEADKDLADPSGEGRVPFKYSTTSAASCARAVVACDHCESLLRYHSGATGRSISATCAAHRSDRCAQRIFFKRLACVLAMRAREGLGRVSKGMTDKQLTFMCEYDKIFETLCETNGMHASEGSALDTDKHIMPLEQYIQQFGNPLSTDDPIVSALGVGLLVITAKKPSPADRFELGGVVREAANGFSDEKLNALSELRVDSLANVAVVRHLVTEYSSRRQLQAQLMRNMLQPKSEQSDGDDKGTPRTPTKDEKVPTRVAAAVAMAAPPKGIPLKVTAPSAVDAAEAHAAGLGLGSLESASTRYSPDKKTASSSPPASGASASAASGRASLQDEDEEEDEEDAEDDDANQAGVNAKKSAPKAASATRSSGPGSLKCATKLRKRLRDFMMMFTSPAWASNLRGKERASVNLLPAITATAARCESQHREDIAQTVLGYSKVVESAKNLIAKCKGHRHLSSVDEVALNSDIENICSFLQSFVDEGGKGGETQEKYTIEPELFKLKAL